MELKKCKLGDLIELQRGYDLPASQMQKGIVPVAGSNGIIGYHNVSKIKPPCITIGRSGSVGKIHYYDTAIWPHNTSLYVKDFKGNDEKYIYYLLRTIDLGRLCDSSVVPSLNRNFIYPLEVKVYADIVRMTRKFAGKKARVAHLHFLYFYGYSQPLALRPPGGTPKGNRTPYYQN